MSPGSHICSKAKHAIEIKNLHKPIRVPGQYQTFLSMSQPAAFSAFLAQTAPAKQALYEYWPLSLRQIQEKF